MRRCWPFRLSSALAFSDSSGRMKFSAQRLVDDLEPGRDRGRVVGRAVLPEQELEDVDGHVGADLDLADEVLADDAAGEVPVGQLVEAVVGRAQSRSSSTMMLAATSTSSAAEADAGGGVEHLECRSRAGVEVGRHLQGEHPRGVDGGIDRLGRRVEAVAADHDADAVACPARAAAAHATRG